MSKSSFLKFAILAVVAFFDATSGQRNFRLPLNLIPSHYEIRVLPRLDPAFDFSFDGTVRINFTCVEATDTIILHNYLLEIDEANVELTDSDGRSIGIESHEYEWSFTEFQTVTLSESLLEGSEYSLFMPYKGEMVTYAAGLWYGSYTGDNGEEFYAATQLESTSARAVYPGFDEPGLKATFDIIVGRKIEHRAFSNMPLYASAPNEEEDGYMWDYFERSPVMAPYLVALVVGEYSRVPTSDNRQSLLVRDEVTGDVRDAVEFVPQILSILEEKTGTPFPLPKLDHTGVIGFPGGMENYGLIIYGESGITNPASLELMAHETSHMWTGDYVTCQWWDVTWLNEGLTHFWTYYITGMIDTSFDSFTFLGTVLMDSAMYYDTSPDALPMVVPIDEPSDINNAFDGALIYNRGGNIGRVMYYLLGEEAFLSGMKEYFAANAYQPVREENLFSKLNEAAEAFEANLPLSFSDMMSPWTNQPGYPIVTVTRGETVDGTTTFTISQKRHLAVLENDHDDDTLWPIPLTWSTASSPNFDDRVPKDYLLNEVSKEVSIEAESQDWVIFNNQRAAYYRVNYDIESWRLILAALENNSFFQLPEANRAGIVSDISELCFYDLINDNDICFGFTNFLTRERSFNVWATAVKSLLKLAPILERSNINYVTFINKLVDRTEFNLMRTREAMTPQRRQLMNLLKDFKEHINGPNARIPLYSPSERMWNKRFDEQKATMMKRFNKQG